MPRKPRRCIIKLEAMATRSLIRANKGLDDLRFAKVDAVSKTATARHKPLTHITATNKTAALSNIKAIAPKPREEYPKVPALAALIASAMKIDYPAPAAKTRIASPTKMESPLRAASSVSTTVAPTISPSSKENRPKRRKREAIHLPPSVAAAKLSAKEVRRLKNRIAATRLRQRLQQDVRSLQDELEYYKSRCEFLEIVVAGCATCASFSAVRFGEIELLPAEPKKIKIKKEQMPDEQELDDNDDELPMLTEAECVVLDNVLHC